MSLIVTAETLEASFRDTETGGGGEGEGAFRRRLLLEADLDVFTEVRFPGREWALLVRGDGSLEDRELLLTTGLTCRVGSGLIEVVANQSTDHLLYCTLLADLLDQIDSHPAGPVQAVVRRLGAWRRMLGRGLPTGLTPEARIGLYGELLALREVVLPALGAGAVRAWTGPSGAPKDFRAGGTAVEVKTVSRKDADRCRISNEEQLDTEGLQDLFLIHQVAGTSPEGVTLVELVDELRAHPDIQPDLAWFDDGLLEAGWLDAHRDQYMSDRYVLVRRRCYGVTDNFPRMTKADLPVGVSGVSYLVDLSACGSGQVGEETVRRSVAEAGDLAEG